MTVGQVALPKQHQPDDIPALYGWQRNGVAYSSTGADDRSAHLIEAAASGRGGGTHDGGPPDILAHCENGVLVDPLDSADIARGLLAVVSDTRTWQRYARRGISGVARNYTWDAHVDKYLKAVNHVVHRTRKQVRRERVVQRPAVNPMPYVRRMLVSDIDNTLIGDRAGLATLVRVLRERPRNFGFGVATGRHLPSALEALRQARVPLPDVLITAVGTEIHYGPGMHSDAGWQRHIRTVAARCVAALFEDVPD